MHSPDEAAEIAATFVATPFSGEPRHQRRIDILDEYQRTGVPPTLPPDQIP
jgi:ribose 5-phosphate isomerase B